MTAQRALGAWSAIHRYTPEWLRSVPHFVLDVARGWWFISGSVTSAIAKIAAVAFAVRVPEPVSQTVLISLLVLACFEAYHRRRLQSDALATKLNAFSGTRDDLVAVAAYLRVGDDIARLYDHTHDGVGDNSWHHVWPEKLLPMFLAWEKTVRAVVHKTPYFARLEPVTNADVMTPDSQRQDVKLRLRNLRDTLQLARLYLEGLA